MVDLTIAGGFIAGAILSLLVISNPISTSAVFIALTERWKKREKILLARESIRYSAYILVFFALTGLLLFNLFGFSIGAFRIAGGVLLFTMAISMLNPKHTEKEMEVDYHNIAFMPLSIPFTAGPGTIITTVVLMTEATALLQTYGYTIGILSMTGVFVGIIVTLLISYLMMVNSQRVNKVFKEGGRLVVTRLMGLIVMAIAVQFFINGIVDIIPQLLAAAG
ncbi:MAG: MarC family protein [Nanoarchaeota archaeon]|nr:MarC family protein [Nanoarchaeota archaeon]